MSWGLLIIILYPIVHELIFFACSKMSVKQIQKDVKRISREIKGKVPIVISLSNKKFMISNYDIGFFGLHKCYLFNTEKYSKIFRFISKSKALNKNEDIISPGVLPKMYLYSSMSICNIILLNYSFYLSKIFEMPMYLIPAWVVRWKILNPMLYSWYGTVHAAVAAMESGAGINLSGGYHHASRNSGRALCAYPDISIAINTVRNCYKIKRIMVIDIDAHQSIGVLKDFGDDEDVYIIDWYNPDIHPQHQKLKSKIDKEILLDKTMSNEFFYKKLFEIKTCFEKFKPEFIVYIAGTDILEGDKWGKLNFSSECIVKRDKFVMRLATENKIPICMVLSGGFKADDYKVIGTSIVNLLPLIKSFSGSLPTENNTTNAVNLTENYATPDIEGHDYADHTIVEKNNEMNDHQSDFRSDINASYMSENVDVIKENIKISNKHYRR